MILAALCAGAFATSGVLWFSGVGSSGVAASARLNKLRDVEASLPTESRTSLRRRGSVNFAGITVLSGNLASTWTKDLERAGLTINAKEYLILRSFVSLGFAAAILLFAPFPCSHSLGCPWAFSSRACGLSERRHPALHKMESQLIELLQMLSSGLRAGFGLIQALEASGDQVPAPLQFEVRRTLRDMAMGASVEQALSSLNERVGSSDFDIVITAILIQRSVGGNLAEILDNVAHTMRERERIRGEIRTLTSQQRMTGFVIGGIPIGLLLIFIADESRIHWTSLHRSIGPNDVRRGLRLRTHWFCRHSEDCEHRDLIMEFIVALSTFTTVTLMVYGLLHRSTEGGDMDTRLGGLRYSRPSREALQTLMQHLRLASSDQSSADSKRRKRHPAVNHLGTARKDHGSSRS